MLAASACNLLRVDPLVMARLLNIGIFFACFIVLDRLLARIHVRRTHALFCLVFFSAAPVNLFYFRSTIVDGLAICFSLVTVLFQAVGDKTELVLTHEFFPDENMRDEHNKGWNGCLENLAKFVE